jgi:hypothetical protein
MRMPLNEQVSSLESVRHYCQCKQTTAIQGEAKSNTVIAAHSNTLTSLCTRKDSTRPEREEKQPIRPAHQHRVRWVSVVEPVLALSVPDCWFRGVVVITSALHAECRGFNPHRNQTAIFLLENTTKEVYERGAGMPSSAALLVAACTALMKPARTPARSSSCTPAIVVPPGEHTCSARRRAVD